MRGRPRAGVPGPDGGGVLRRRRHPHDDRRRRRRAVERRHVDDPRNSRQAWARARVSEQDKGGGAAAVERHRKRGKLTARERIERLLDPTLQALRPLSRGPLVAVLGVRLFSLKRGWSLPVYEYDEEAAAAYREAALRHHGAYARTD